MRNLSIGSVGPEVQKVQQALNQCMLLPNNPFSTPRMTRLVEDARFGPKTAAMVREFQRLNKIKIDGIVGPITSCLIFPYISFKTELAGTGKIRGIPAGDFLNPLQLPNRNAFNLSPASPAGRPPFGRQTQTQPTPAAAGGDDTEREGLTFELALGQGSKTEFKPWFVLKPNEDPAGAESSATLTAEATIVRVKGLEFGSQLEFSRSLQGQGQTWQWEGSIFGKYTNAKIDLGPVSAGVSPIVDLKLKQDLLFSTSAGLEAEASIELSKDLLELSVGGKVAAEWEPHAGNVQIGGEVSVGLKFKWDVVRTVKKK